MASWRSARAASGPRDRRHRTGWRAALVAAVVALVAAGCGSTSPPSSDSSPSPRTTLTACTVAGGIAADCGTVRVPADWAHPDGLGMALRVVVLPATGTGRPAPPLFYLAGYNGDSAGFGDAVLNGLDWAASRSGS